MRVLRSFGPAVIVMLVIAGALLGYYQIVYYPAGHKATSTTVIPVDPHNVTVTIAAGAGSGPNAAQTYVPDNVVVFIGYNATIVWKNNDTTVHTVTASGNPPDPRFALYGPIAQPWNNIQAKGSAGDSSNFTFIVSGTYSYYCSYHRWMNGKVTVEAAPAGLVGASGTTTKISTFGAFVPLLFGVSDYNGFLLLEAAFLIVAAAMISSRSSWSRQSSSFIFHDSDFAPAATNY